jgi:hypothetical protein
MIHRAVQSGLALCWALALTPGWAGAEGEKLGGAVREQLATDKDSRASQQRIDAIDDETLKMLSEYRRALADAESYAIYARQLEAQVEAQNQEMASIEQQLGEIETTSREVLPLMQRMLATLARFVDLDTPFLLEERRKRIATLEATMARADVTLSEKYRRIVEAYQVEMDYGRTLEAYEAKLGDGDDARTVQFLRVGRVALLYQTLDARETGYWDADKKNWVIDDDYQHGFKEGIAVARKLRAPEMLVVPIPAPRETKS